jgi:hypothetical protein
MKKTILDIVLCIVVMFVTFFVLSMVRQSGFNEGVDVGSAQNSIECSNLTIRTLNTVLKLRNERSQKQEEAY